MAAIEKSFHMAEDDALSDLRPIYLFTWNPKDSFTNDDEPIRKWDTMLIRVLKHFKRCMQYYAVMPEISDQGRLHCHGWFIIKDKIKWIKSVLPLIKRNGHFKMNKMKVPKALYYYKKDAEDTQGILHTSTLPFSHYTYDKILHELWIKYKIIEGYEKPQPGNILDYIEFI